MNSMWRLRSSKVGGPSHSANIGAGEKGMHPEESLFGGYTQLSNSLLQEVRQEPSLLAFSWHVKTVLFLGA